MGTKVEIKRNSAAPSVFIFPPSADELKSGTATIVCVANKYFPDVTVTWKVDNKVQSSGIENSKTGQNSQDCTYNLSSTLSLSATEYNSHNEYTCEVAQGSGSPITQSFNRNDC